MKSEPHRKIIDGILLLQDIFPLEFNSWGCINLPKVFEHKLYSH